MSFGNKGYVGQSRSVRSANAIASYELPLTLINRENINSFLSDNFDDFNTDEIELLKSISVAKWKFVGEHKVGANSWHHTGKFFNETNHYSMSEIAIYIIDNRNIVDEQYSQFIQKDQQENEKFKYGYIKTQIWGGTRNRPKLEGFDTQVGIVIGDWLYYQEDQKSNWQIKKYKTKANKVENFFEYDTYEELISKHKEFKSTKRYFNKLIKSKGLENKPSQASKLQNIEEKEEKTVMGYQEVLLKIKSKNQAEALKYLINEESKEFRLVEIAGILEIRNSKVFKNLNIKVVNDEQLLWVVGDRIYGENSFINELLRNDKSKTTNFFKKISKISVIPIEEVQDVFVGYSFDGRVVSADDWRYIPKRMVLNQTKTDLEKRGEKMAGNEKYWIIESEFKGSVKDVQITNQQIFETIRWSDELLRENGFNVNSEFIADMVENLNKSWQKTEHFSFDSFEENFAHELEKLEYSAEENLKLNIDGMDVTFNNELNNDQELDF